eukprot:564944-Hanusia_phi.AAC.1
MVLTRFSPATAQLELTSWQERMARPGCGDHLDFGERRGRNGSHADAAQMVNPAYIRSEVARWAGEREK